MEIRPDAKEIMKNLPESVGGVPLKTLKVKDLSRIKDAQKAKRAWDKDPEFGNKVRLYLMDVMKVDATTKLDGYALLEFAGRNWKTINRYWKLKKMVEAAE